MNDKRTVGDRVVLTLKNSLMLWYKVVSTECSVNSRRRYQIAELFPCVVVATSEIAVGRR